MMSISPRVRRVLLICLLAATAVMYGIAWFSPAIGLAYRDGAALLQAVTFRGTAEPPLFALVLRLFAAVSRNPQWLKVLPLLCTLAWLALTTRLLTRMGASRACGWTLIAITVVSPTVMLLGTGLFPEPLFALFMTACLLMLLDERPMLAGVCAGLATITMTAGVALIAACLLTLVAHRRLRSAIEFLIPAMVFASPWLGWWLAHGGMSAAKLQANEWGMLLGKNAMWLAAAPFTLMSGYASLYPGLLTALALLIVLVRRRQFVPDLFFGFYCLALACRAEPPLTAFAPVLPLFLWMLWRVARNGRFAVIAQVVAVAMIGPGLWFGVAQLRKPTGWAEMTKLFGNVRAKTAPASVLMADLDPVIYLNTGRRTVRGFAPDGYRSYYAPPRPLVTPDQLQGSVLRDHVDYVVLTPDRDIPESASYRSAVQALERGGMLEPVETDDLPTDYRLLRVIRLSKTK